MNKEQLLDHYRNLYQIVKQDKDSIERELEEFKTLCTIQQDIINDCARLKDYERRTMEQDDFPDKEFIARK